MGQENEPATNNNSSSINGKTFARLFCNFQFLNNNMKCHKPCSRAKNLDGGGGAVEGKSSGKQRKNVTIKSNNCLLYKLVGIHMGGS